MMFTDAAPGSLGRVNFLIGHEKHWLLNQSSRKIERL